MSATKLIAALLACFAWGSLAKPSKVVAGAPRSPPPKAPAGKIARSAAPEEARPKVVATKAPQSTSPKAPAAKTHSPAAAKSPVAPRPASTTTVSVPHKKAASKTPPTASSASPVVKASATKAPIAKAPSLSTTTTTLAAPTKKMTGKIPSKASSESRVSEAARMPPAKATVTKAPAAKAPVANAGRKWHTSVKRILVDELFLGVDPLGATNSTVAGDAGEEEFPNNPNMTHIARKDIDMVLEFAPQPVNFWIELGAYEGGSTLLTAERCAMRSAQHGESPATTILAVDTFLGDTRTLWQVEPAERRHMLREDGTVVLYERFSRNICRAGRADIVLPMLSTSVVALRVIAALARRGVVPAPQVIYLDSAHEEGEVLLELELAWKALAPDGIMFGDDWMLPPSMSDEAEGREEGNMVRRDVLRFAEAHEAELDDTFGPQVQPMRTLGRPRAGLFISYNSFQWFMRKGASGTSQRAPTAVTSGFDCWSDGYDSGDCCDEDRFGPGGNEKCWDLVFTFEQCCQQSFK